MNENGHRDFFEMLEAAAATGDDALRHRLLTTQAGSCFATPDLPKVWSVVSDWDISCAPTAMPMLVKAWLSFLCGDRAALTGMAPALYQWSASLPQKPVDRQERKERSMFHALKALSGLVTDPEERLLEAQASLEVLEEESSFYQANAKMTLAQVLAGLGQYRRAETFFWEAMQAFRGEGLHFPAAVSAVNALLNRFRLGQLTGVLEEGKRLLADGANFQGDAQSWWNIVQLPLGMACCELNRPALAVRYLKNAGDCIDAMRLFHMHGLLEQALFRALWLQRDTEGLTGLLQKATAQFAPMNHPFFELLLAQFRVLVADLRGEGILEEDTDVFLLPGPVSGAAGMWIREEMCAWLTIQGRGDWPAETELPKALEHLRFSGNRPQLQLFLLLAAEVSLLREDTDNAQVLLQEAVAIWRETGGCAGFLTYPRRAVHLLRVLDPKRYASLLPTLQRYQTPPQETARAPLLTDREREILQLAAAGKSNTEIGKTLFLGVSTVKWHINNIFSKLEAQNRVQAIARGRELGEVE